MHKYQSFSDYVDKTKKALTEGATATKQWIHDNQTALAGGVIGTGLGLVGARKQSPGLRILIAALGGAGGAGVGHLANKAMRPQNTPSNTAQTQALLEDAQKTPKELENEASNLQSLGIALAHAANKRNPRLLKEPPIGTSLDSAIWELGSQKLHTAEARRRALTHARYYGMEDTEYPPYPFGQSDASANVYAGLARIPIAKYSLPSSLLPFTK